MGGTNTNFGRDFGQQAGQTAGTVALDAQTKSELESTTANQGAAGSQPWPMALNADARNAALTSGLWTLASGVVESITIPAFARGFRLRPSADIRFAIGEDPVAAGTETLTVGATAFANESEIRLLESGAATLRLLATGAATVQVSFF